MSYGYCFVFVQIEPHQIPILNLAEIDGFALNDDGLGAKQGQAFDIFASVEELDAVVADDEVINVLELFLMAEIGLYCGG